MRISTENLHKTYKRRTVVKGVSIHLEQGEIVGLLGPNGAGKTTTFYMVVGLVRPNKGRIHLDSTEVTRWPMFKRARQGVGYLAQESSVFRRLCVEDNFRLVLEANRIPKHEATKRIKEIASELHITHLLSETAGVLSGGERRRVEIARAMVIQPKFILLDEPFTGIDPVTIEELQQILRSLRDKGIGILITDHNVGATLGITDRNYILVSGEIIAKGTSSEITADPLVRKHYLGTQFAGEGDVDPA